MRSIGFTTFLALVTAVISSLAVLQWQQGSFDLIFGKPATPVGERLYDSFAQKDVARIIIHQGHSKATFVRKQRGWICVSPWNDRMDPVAAAAIIQFTLGMRVEDHAPEHKVAAKKSGLGANAVSLRLENDDGEPLANYRLGRISPWMAELEEGDPPVNTVFIKTKDANRRTQVYVCTGDITPLFKDGLKLLRDHRPLYFNPLNLEKITIHSQQGDLTLGHETPQQAWRILKPLDLATDQQALLSLLEGLYKLRATSVSNRSDVTLPATGAATKTTQISLTRFGSTEPTMLEIFPPESLDATQVMAVVSDRPGTVFTLPLKPAPSVVSLADLPLDVNSLRDPTLTHLDVAAIKAIAITPSTGPEILISREPGTPWLATVNNRRFSANEENLYALLQAVTTTRATGFESDAASDFSPWGLDRPILKIRFLGRNNQVLELRFGINSKGEYFANRLGTSTVMRVDPSLIHAIAVMPHEWKHSRLWSINSVYLQQMLIKYGDQEPLTLKYDFNDESWQASRGATDLTPHIVQTRANYLLRTIEGMRVHRWLRPGDGQALSALTNPTLTVTVTEKQLDDDGNEAGLKIRTLILAPAPEPELRGYYYGLMSTSSNPFLLDSSTYEKISADLLDE